MAEALRGRGRGGGAARRVTFCGFFLPLSLPRASPRRGWCLDCVLERFSCMHHFVVALVHLATEPTRDPRDRAPGPRAPSAPSVSWRRRRLCYFRIPSIIRVDPLQRARAGVPCLELGHLDRQFRRHARDDLHVLDLRSASVRAEAARSASLSRGAVFIDPRASRRRPRKFTSVRVSSLARFPPVQFFSGPLRGIAARPPPPFRPRRVAYECSAGAPPFHQNARPAPPAWRDRRGRPALAP